MHPRFVGRAAELAELTARLSGALAGEPGIVLVGGEPGIGKTRLAAELGRLAEARAVPVLWGGCSEDVGAPAYWPWRRVLRAWAAAGNEVPAELAPIAAGGGPAEPGPAGRFALFDAMAGFLAKAAASAGLVVVLDDLQWADAASIALLAHVAREPGPARLLLVGTHRPAEQRVSPAEVPGTRIALAGLGPAEVAALSGAADPAELVRRTGGNPFFVRELGFGSGVPGSVREIVGRRLARLPDGCRSLLLTAAVAGRESRADLLATVAGCPLDTVLDDLAPAVADGLLERTGTRLRFAHDLVREALLVAAADRERAERHLAVLQALLPRRDDPDVLPELAGHALAALPLGDPTEALHWVRAAGELALRQQAFEEAARLFARALDEIGAPPAERLDLLLATATALSLSHDVAGTMERADEAVDLARRLGDTEAIGRAALVLPGISDPGWLGCAGPWTAEALDGLPVADSPLRAQLLAQRAHAAAVGADPLPVERDSAAALGMAERLDDPPSLVAALRARQLARAGPDGNADRLELGTRLLRIAERTGDPDDALWGRLWRFDALLQAGRVADAEHEADLLEPLVTRLRRPLARVHLLRSRAALAYGRGRFAEATTLNEEASELGGRGRHFAIGVLTSAVRFALATLTGDSCPEQEWVPELALGGEVPNVAILRAELAHWFVEEGRRAEAEAVYRLLPPVGSPRIPGYILLVVECKRAIAAADLGDRATGEACLRWLRQYTDLHLTGGAGAVTTGGSVHLYAGIAAQAAGRADAAVRHLRQAVAIDDAAGLAPFAALARSRLAEVLQRRGDRSEAGDLAAAALRAARELGMRPLERRITAAGSGPLSRREAEIAALVGKGLTNRQIAAAAHISERTVETHVQHILAKLGFSGRSQIAAWVARGPG